MDRVLEFAQFRTLTNTYFFKVTNDKVVLKVYDLASRILKHVWTREASPDMFADPLKTLSEIREEPVGFFEKVKEIHPAFEIPELNPPAPSLEKCQKYIRDAINALESKIVIETEEMKNFTCPITQCTIEDPVTTPCGHNFEKQALQTARVTDPNCPFCRTPIVGELSTNCELRNTIQKWKKEGSIPTFSSFKKINYNIAQRQLRTAREFVEEKDYEGAIKAYKTAFEYTQDPGAYKAVPELYQKLEEPEKERLAWLHYALYSITFGSGASDISEGILGLEKAKEIGQTLGPSLLVNFALIMLQSYGGSSRSQIRDLIQEAVPLLTTEGLEGDFYAKQMHLQDRSRYYQILVDALKDQNEAQQIVFAGMDQALKEGDTKEVNIWLAHLSNKKLKSNAYFENILLHSQARENRKKDDGLDDLEKKADHCFKRLNTFSPASKKNYSKAARQAFKLLFHLKKTKNYEQAIVDSYLAEGKQHKAFPRAFRLLDAYLEEKSYDLIEALTNEVIVQAGLPIEDKILWYKKLDDSSMDEEVGIFSISKRRIYIHLGNFYKQLNQLEEAEGIYTKAYEYFKESKAEKHKGLDGFFLCQLASLLEKRGKHRPAVITFYRAAEIAISSKDRKSLEECYQGIIAIDPEMGHLDPVQKVNLVCQRQILTLEADLKKANKKIDKISKRLDADQAEKGTKRPHSETEPDSDSEG